MPTRPNHDERFQVVFVCTGNRARSALAEALYRRYTGGSRTDVGSAGILELGPVPALSAGIDAGHELGVDLTSHRARSIRRLSLAAADLVLGFEPQHVAAAVVEAMARPERTFLLGEFVTLVNGASASGDPVAHARALVAQADAGRMRYRPDANATLRDPIGRSDKFMRETAAEIDRLVRRLVHSLFGIDVTDNGSTAGRAARR